MNILQANKPGDDKPVSGWVQKGVLYDKLYRGRDRHQCCGHSLTGIYS